MSCTEVVSESDGIVIYPENLCDEREMAFLYQSHNVEKWKAIPGSLHLSNQ